MSIEITFEAVLVVLAWFTFTTFMLLYAVPWMASRRICKQFGLVRVVTPHGEIYAPMDDNGDAMQFVVGWKKDKDGKDTPEPVMGYLPLSRALPVMAASYAAQTIKMSVLSAKGKGARFLNQIVGEEMLEGMDEKDQELVALAEAIGGHKWAKRAQMALALKKRFAPGGRSDKPGPQGGWKV